MTVFDCNQPESRETGLDAANDALQKGELAVLPTDTVYGLGANAFDVDAVTALLEAKGRERTMPPPVLVGDPAVLNALAIDVPTWVHDLVARFWPGALTLVLTAQPTLTWDLGETKGTVALRMPDDEIALELLRRTGPLAVSSANKSGRPAATTVLEAATMLGDAVAVYLDGGASAGGTASTIVDATKVPAAILREGALSTAEIVAVVGDVFTAPEPPAEETTDADPPADDAPADDAPADDTPVEVMPDEDVPDGTTEPGPTSADDSADDTERVAPDEPAAGAPTS